MNDKELLLKVKSDATDLFVKDKVDTTQPNVIAAIAVAAGNMALASDGDRTLSDTQEAMLSVFGASENEEVLNMMEMMNQNGVKNTIGFATDYTDYGKARLAYEAQKEKYDELYNGLAVVNEIIASKEEGIQR